VSRSVVVGYHGHCFDGMCSAALVTRLLRETAREELVLSYRGLDHQPGGSHVPEDVLAGDINVVVDFRYTTSPRLSWWFDHHVSGLVTEAERAHFEADASGRKFFDPSYGSCCKLIADIARDRFGLALDDLAETVHWADVIDAARFDSSATAVELKHPALQLMTVVEAFGDDSFVAPRAEALSRGASLADLAADAEVQRRFTPLLREHRATCELIREKSVLDGGVVFFDVADSGRERYNKFIPYFLHPSSRYSVAVTASKRRAKVSVGSNPWAPVPRSHDIASLCARYGGGGHPVVGAISLAADQLDRARQIAREICEELVGVS
jgi:hypothetical protein